ncbi:MAG: hypothetical protein FWF97_03000 [Alphaproteobacteria bacterium]|nr:hypothetical protein [Alphaproteobacteria bacterium]
MVSIVKKNEIKINKRQKPEIKFTKLIKQSAIKIEKKLKPEIKIEKKEINKSNIGSYNKKLTKIIGLIDELRSELDMEYDSPELQASLKVAGELFVLMNSSLTAMQAQAIEHYR